jgi:hypothetical protein
MRSTTLLSVEQYLSTTFRPDCDYVEGQIRERNVGEGGREAKDGVLRTEYPPIEVPLAGIFSLL